MRIVLRPTETLLLRAGRVGGNTFPRQSIAPLDDGQGREALAESLTSPGWRAGRLDVVISNALVRYVVTEPPGAFLSRSEERALATARLAAIYGETARDWRLVTQSQPPDAGVFAAAIPAALFDAVRAAAAKAGIRRLRLRPLLDVAGARAKGPFANGWWVLAEPGWWCLLEAHRGAWRQIVSEPCVPEWPEHLALRLERAVLAAGRAPSPMPVRVQAVGTPLPDRIDHPAGWTGERVEPKGGGAWHWEAL